MFQQSWTLQDDEEDLIEMLAHFKSLLVSLNDSFLLSTTFCKMFVTFTYAGLGNLFYVYFFKAFKVELFRLKCFVDSESDLDCFLTKLRF